MRVFVWKGIQKNTPLSSKIHCYVKNASGLDSNRYRSNCNREGYLSSKLNHWLNFGLVIEKNPGPSVYVDATKTVHAPYYQGYVAVFGGNAGQQCVAKSLCALIYNQDKKN